MEAGRPRRRTLILALLLGTTALLAGGGYLSRRAQTRLSRISRIGDWFADPAAHRQWQVDGGTRCGTAPMLIPTSGFIGVGYGDGLPPLYRHTGYDIFSPDGQGNVTPVVAAYDGWLTREPDWRSAVIIRHPDFPLPDRTATIWTYYTHMASTDGQVSFIAADFPPGTHERFVSAGTLLGYQGTWSGDPDRATGLHLHFSVVRSLAGGGYANETEIANTFDPGPFLGLEADLDGTIRCTSGDVLDPGRPG